MRHHIIGTAGHIDHGKTSLTKSLTNTDTDRLQEEKKRNISIELGFAPFILPSGRRVSIIDVPGHERFIRHMVAGVGGIDLVLLVIAADEGIMPQTTEHLHILDLLGITKGIIVLTKTDLVEEDFLELVREDVQASVENTFLADAPVIETSVVTQRGIDRLKEEIECILSSIPGRPVGRPFQLPIDRVFTLKGIGTVITGTVYSGKVSVGDEVEVLPAKLKVRVRQLQVHGEDTDTVFAGQRAALNLTQVKKNQLARGDVLARPGQWKPTRRIDAFVSWLPEAPTIKHQSRVKLYIGSKESEAKMILYDRKALTGGEETYASFRLAEPIVASRSDRFIVRRPSPAATLGGGEIVQPYAQQLKYRPDSAKQIQRAHKSRLNERIRDTLARGPLVQFVPNLAQTLTESEADVDEKLRNMQTTEEVVEVLPRQVSLNERLEETFAEGVKWLNQYHDQYPLRQGPSKAAWAARFFPGMPNKTLDALLRHRHHQLKINGETISARTFQPFIPPHLQKQSDQLIETVRQMGLESHPWEELAAEKNIDPESSADLLTYHVNKGDLVIVEDDRVISGAAFEKAKRQIIDFLRKSDQLTLQEARSLFPLSRRHLIPLLELMDQFGVTRREGNVRLLK